MLFMSCYWLKAYDSAVDLLHLILWFLSYSHLLSTTQDNVANGGSTNSKTGPTHNHYNVWSAYPVDP